MSDETTLPVGPPDDSPIDERLDRLTCEFGLLAWLLQRHEPVTTPAA